MKKTKIAFLLLAIGVTLFTACDESQATDRTAEPASSETTTTAAPEPTSTEEVATEEAPELALHGLQIYNCSYPVKIVEGDSFEFPEGLLSLGITVKRTRDGYYSVYQTSEDPETDIENDVTTDLTQIAVSSDDSVTSFLFDGKGSNKPVLVRVFKNTGQISFEKKGQSIAYNAFESKPGSSKSQGTVYLSPNQVFQELIIKVPKNSDLVVEGSSRLRVDVPLATLTFTGESTTSNHFVKKVGKIERLVLGGTGSFTIDTVGLCESIELVQQSAVIIKSCDSVVLVTAEGASDVSLPTSTKIGRRTLSGTASIH